MSEIRDAATGTASRRALVGGAVGIGVGVPLLAACGSDSKDKGAGGASASSASGSGGGTTSSGALAKTSEVPVGSGKIYKAEKVVVTQPAAGEFKAFSSICTHQGCPVSKIVGTDIECSCHGSKFSIEDGSVTNGPANKPLSEVAITVSGEDISVT